MLNIW